MLSRSDSEIRCMCVYMCVCVCVCVQCAHININIVQTAHAVRLIVLLYHREPPRPALRRQRRKLLPNYCVYFPIRFLG